jgi:GAF domain-containing protein
VGFYLVDFEQDNLVLGPFQGPVACTRLFRGKGVCAAAWEQKRTQVVPDVHAFPGHVACSSASLSEVVLPVRNSRGEVVAVWDIDSAEGDDFAPDDVAALEGLTSVISSMWDSWTWAT